MPRLRDLTDEQIRDMLAERIPPPLSLEEPGFGARLLASFGTTPQGKQNILDRFGIEGSLRDPVGPDVGDIADFAGDAPTAILSALGTFAGSRVGQPARGGAAGAFVGENVRQSIGNLLGSQEQPDLVSMGIETAAGGIGEKVGGGLLNKIANPLRANAVTANVRQNVMEPASRFGVTGLPADAVTEAPSVVSAAGRARARSSAHGDELRQAQAAFQDRQRDAFERIATRSGAPTSTPPVSPDDLLSTAEGAREAREELIGEMFDEARDALGNTNFPVVVDETRQALARMAKRGNITTLRGSNIVSAAQREFNKLIEDVNKIQTFKQMDAFRQEIGNLLNNPVRMEELRKAGGDVDFRDVYGGLKRDLEASLGEGKLAQEFGGQTRGQLGRTIENRGRENVSRMEQGILGERDLPKFPGREREVARGRVPQRPPGKAFGDEQLNPGDLPGEARSSTELLDELTGRIDTAQSLRDDAAAQFADLINTENSTIIRMLRDPSRAENINNLLFRRGGSAENVRAFKQHIGAEPTPGGNPLTEEGVKAWQAVQAQLFRDIRNEAEDAAANRLPGQAAPLAGEAMERALNQFGGNKGILDEAIGPEATQELYDFARFLREVNPNTRTFANVSKTTAEREQNPTFFVISLIRTGLERVFDGALRRTRFPAPGRASDFLTTGLAPEREGLLRAIGTAVTQPAVAGAFTTSRDASNRR